MNMKKSILFFAVIPLAFLLTSCKDHLEVVFDDYYVCVKSEDGAASSTVSSAADQLVMTYYFNLVSVERDEDLTVNFDVVAGDGLKEGVDFVLPTDSRSVTFSKGIYKRPFRINFLKHTLDPSKDNTITIKITSTSDPSITIGYPGPSAKFSSHVITKN